MRRLDRYIVSEMIVPSLIGTLAIVLMFQVNTYMFFAKNFDLKNVPTVAVMQVILFRTPEYLTMTLPVGVSLAASLAMSRIARESELTAMRACGMRILRVLMPVAFVGLLFAGANYYVVEKLQPVFTKRSNAIAYRVGFQGSLPQVNENVPVKLGRYAAFLGRVHRIGSNDLDVENVLLVERPKPTEWFVTTAKQARYRSGVWTFEGAWMARLENDQLTHFQPKKDFKVEEEILVENFSTPAVAEEFSREELAERIRIAKSNGADTREDEVKYHTKISVPAACVVFALVAPIFAILFARGGSFVGILLSVVLVMLYYNAFVVSTQILGKFDFMPPWLSAWAPNLVFGFLGLLAIRRLE